MVVVDERLEHHCDFSFTIIRGKGNKEKHVLELLSFVSDDVSNYFLNQIIVFKNWKAQSSHFLCPSQCDSYRHDILLN